MKTQKHNPDYKLISIVLTIDINKTAEFVYGETNTGEDKGLEVYRHKDGNTHHYKSNRYNWDAIPAKYLAIYDRLKSKLKDCPSGHKLELDNL